MTQLMRRNQPLRSSSFFLSVVMLLMMASCGRSTKRGTEALDTIALAPTPVFVADSAMAYIVTQCAFGPRVPGSPAHEACGNWIASRFTALGTTVSEQRTQLAGYDGQLLPCRNIMAS